MGEMMKLSVKCAIQKAQARVANTFRTKNSEYYEETTEHHPILERQNSQRQFLEQNVAASNAVRGMWNSVEGNGKVSMVLSPPR